MVIPICRCPAAVCESSPISLTARAVSRASHSVAIRRSARARPTRGPNSETSSPGSARATSTASNSRPSCAAMHSRSISRPTHSALSRSIRWPSWRRSSRRRSADSWRPRLEVAASTSAASRSAIHTGRATISSSSSACASTAIASHRRLTPIRISRGYSPRGMTMCRTTSISARASGSPGATVPRRRLPDSPAQCEDHARSSAGESACFRIRRIRRS